MFREENMVNNWKELLKNDGVDAGERSAVREEISRTFNNNVENFAQELKDLYRKYQSYKDLKKLFEDEGYKIEEYGDYIKIYKEL